MKNRYCLYIILSLLSVVGLSLPYLMPHAGSFALIGLVPLLWMDYTASRDKVRHFFWWHYLVFVLWNAATTFWVCNATVGGGLFAIFANALQMSVIWSVFRWSKKYFTGMLPYIFLVALWIGWEHQYFDAEVSWPWLVLGNAFAYSTTMIQWYDATGALGGSLWVWVCNLAVFGLFYALQTRRWNGYTLFARVTAIVLTVLAFALPLTISWVRYSTFAENTSEGSIEACALQPDFDPYQKFVSFSQEEQNAVLHGMTSDVLAGRDSLAPLLLVAPETFTSDVMLNEIESSRTLSLFRRQLASYPNVNMLMGVTCYEFIYQHDAPSYTARQYRPDVWYEDHNSAVMLDGTGRNEVYHKSRLVVGVEKMPWPRVLSKVDNMLGGVIGRCVGQSEAGLLHFTGSCGVASRGAVSDGVAGTGATAIGCAICYESIYPEYFASYVGKGAKAMAVITNDAWWGDTPGYRQHLRYSCLRAIETRRDIVRSANTGISAFINQRGDIVSQTDWWTRETLSGTLYLNSALTPFVCYGDIIGRIACFVVLLLAAAALIRKLR